ncbi:winged helix-turn-helix domain-containing protein [Planctomicrobium sp. SH661]|uniref:winged helix-turn-helix domain-containing protein n=1 Tax=Planctomicrobium sp. SH661 TaxID=3448124 RepID=UPI003F5BDD36
MNPEKQERIRQKLKSLAEAQAATIELLQDALILMSEELSLDPITFWKSRGTFTFPGPAVKSDLFDMEMLTVTYQEKSCFLGNTLPFRFFVRLARRPNIYVTHEDLLTDVWDGVRTDEAIRSVVKTLRSKLREADMASLADAIDGAVPGHYALKLEK